MAEEARGASEVGDDGQEAHASAQLECSHMFVRGRMMDMAISVLGLIVGGGIKAYSDLAAFEAAIIEAVPGFRHLPEDKDLPPMLP